METDDPKKHISAEKRVGDFTETTVTENGRTERTRKANPELIAKISKHIGKGIELTKESYHKFYTGPEDEEDSGSNSTGVGGLLRGVDETGITILQTRFLNNGNPMPHDPWIFHIKFFSETDIPGQYVMRDYISQATIYGERIL